MFLQRQGSWALVRDRNLRSVHGKKLKGQKGGKATKPLWSHVLFSTALHASRCHNISIPYSYSIIFKILIHTVFNPQSGQTSQLYILILLSNI